MISSALQKAAAYDPLPVLARASGRGMVVPVGVMEKRGNSEGNLLPLELVPDGWLWTVELIDGLENPFECLLIKYEGRESCERIGAGTTPRAAMLAAIARLP